MTRFSFYTMVALGIGIVQSHWAQDLSSPIEVFELKIDDNESVFSPLWIKGNAESGELILVISEKKDIKKLPRKFRKNQSDFIFNLQRVQFSTQSPFEITNKELLGKNINTVFQEGPSTFDSKNKILYFTRSSKKITKDRKLNLSIYSVAFDETISGTPKKLDLGDVEDSFMHPSIDTENNILYFSSNQGENDDYDLYLSKMDSLGKFSTIQKLPQVNSVANEAFPYVFKNLLFFASNREGGMGNYDVYYSKMEEGQLSTPVLLPSPINSGSDDFSLSLLDSLPLGFFSSNRKKDTLDNSYVIRFKGLSGNSDVYEYASFVTSVEERNSVLVNDSLAQIPLPFLNPPKTILVDGTQTGKVELNSDGTFNYFTEDENSKNDFFTYRITDGFRTSEPILVTLKRLESEIILRPIYYDFARFNLIEKYRSRLDSIANLMLRDPNIHLKISSMTDARGSFSSNKKLAKNRSKTIFKYLTDDQRIDKKRLSVEDYGERHIVGNTVADCLIEVVRSFDQKVVNEKIAEFLSYNPFVYKNNDESYSLIINQYDSKKQALKFIKKLSRKKIESRLILNRFIDVTESEHQKNRKTVFKILPKNNIDKR
ncbi:MAG: OmpA family protein [Flavobacteriaceae bacterium]|jgi:outer membrane protein OmpA-like peptidoglycan-associated protein|nr:OmpA family protein [Flavobacteriaceae bacterium]MBT5506096.1 OmpA family protein [Flammeovirgaceae bacterium]